MHLSEWKNYCNLIQEIGPKNSNKQSQLHQDMIHEGSTFQQHAKDIPFKQAKWFAKDITEFFELNVNSLAKWITIAMKVIRSSRRKIRQDR